MENSKNKRKVFKFGGASVKDAAGVQLVADIIVHKEPNCKKAIVISAMGKTTRALEGVVESYFNGDSDKAFERLNEIKQFHTAIIADLNLQTPEILNDLNDTFVEVEWILEDDINDGFDYLYDQIVSIGELISTKIVYHYLKSKEINVRWIDARDVIFTDNTYREAKVDWNTTHQRVNHTYDKLWEDCDMVITQGFIGSSSENFTTTLGLEGSDYTGGILSFCLEVEDFTIWKDVPGILTADPKLFDNVDMIHRLDYREAIEMTYFGAKVIHPKTIKPLQNKSIPLYVKSFNNPDGEGTVITSDVHQQYPPVVVISPHQTLIHISTNDFSFVAEEHLSEIFSLLNKYRLKVNMMRNSAISFTVSVNYVKDKIEAFEKELTSYTVLKDEQLELITIRHYDDATFDRLTKDKIIIFEERLKNTIRAVVRSTPLLKYKS